MSKTEAHKQAQKTEKHGHIFPYHGWFRLLSTCLEGSRADMHCLCIEQSFWQLSLWNCAWPLFCSEYLFAFKYGIWKGILFLSNDVSSTIRSVLFYFSVTLFCIARDLFFFFRKVKSLKNNIVYFMDSQVYGDNILQKFWKASLPSSSSLPVVMNTHLSSHSCIKTPPEALKIYCIGCTFFTKHNNSLWVLIYVSYISSSDVFFFSILCQTWVPFSIFISLFLFMIMFKVFHSNHHWRFAIQTFYFLPENCTIKENSCSCIWYSILPEGVSIVLMLLQYICVFVTHISTSV